MADYSDPFYVDKFPAPKKETRESARAKAEAARLAIGDDPKAELADSINPHYYKGFSKGSEVIDIVENLPYNRGAAVKYLARAGNKSVDHEMEDLEKAAWYVQREIDRLKGQQ